MSNGTTQHIPADVRELVAREVFALDADWRREYWGQFRRDFPRQAQAYYDTADRILAILRTPRGEEEAEPVAWRVEFRPRGEIEWQRLGTYDYPDIAEERALTVSSSGRIECRIVPLCPAVAYNEAHAARPTDRSESDGERPLPLRPLSALPRAGRRAVPRNHMGAVATPAT